MDGENIKKRQPTPTYSGKSKEAYQKGYDFGFKDSKRLKERLIKVKRLVKEAWNILAQTKE